LKIYKPYAELSLLAIIRQETTARSFANLFNAGLPSVIAYHISDWIGFITDALIDDLFDEEDNIQSYTKSQLLLKHSAQAMSVPYKHIT